jgi:hypothetical protein
MASSAYRELSVDPKTLPAVVPDTKGVARHGALMSETLVSLVRIALTMVTLWGKIKVPLTIHHQPA